MTILLFPYNVWGHDPTLFFGGSFSNLIVFEGRVSAQLVFARATTIEEAKT